MSVPHASVHTPPATVQELKASIISRRIVLSRSLEKPLRAAFERPDLIAFETGAAFARRCGVPRQTLDRLAHHIGCENFRDMRDLFRKHLKERTAAPTERARQNHDAANGDDTPFASGRSD